MHDGPLTLESVCGGIDAPPDVVQFRHTPGTQVVFGVGASARVGELAAGLAGGSALLVTDPGIVAAGHAGRVEDVLREAGFVVVTFAAVHENPTTDDVGACVDLARGAGVSVIVGLGGGSAMDTAKGCNFLLTNGGEMKDFWGVGKAEKPMLPFIAVPTTAGTGSECQSFALIAASDSHQKMACGDPKAAARYAVLDPELTLTQPRAVAAHTGIDAIAHAVETAVTNKRTAVSFAYSRLAFRLLERSFERVLAEPTDLAARADMQLGAAYAGTAIENSMLGAAHSAANPLTAHYGVIHGEAVGLMLPHVVRMNLAANGCSSGYAALYDGDLPARLEALLEAGGMMKPLVQYGVDASAVPLLAKEAAMQWTAQFNPVSVDEGGFEELYGAALG